MGEIADMMLDGTMCQGCGVWLHDGEDGPGFPEYCSACRQEDEREEREYKAQRKKEAAELAKKIRAIIKAHFKCDLPPDQSREFDAHIIGILKPLYVGDNGALCHEGLIKMVENNKRVKAKAREKAKAKV